MVKAVRKKVGLALGGGSARGLAHIGVLEVLEDAGIPVDMIAGTSMGAMIGALYAQDGDIERIKGLAGKLGSKRFAFLFDPALPKTGLIKGRKIEEELKATLDEARFNDLRMPFACVATDIGTGEEVVIKGGQVWQAVRASGSLPVLFSVAKFRDHYLVDGGLANPVPVSVVPEMQADFLIAVNVMHSKDVRQPTEPNIFIVAMQALSIASYGLIASSLRGADVVVEPNLEHIGFSDFHRAEECIRRGREAAEKVVPEIQRRLFNA